MKTVDFSELYTADYEISRLCAMYQHWKEGGVFQMSTPRSTSCLLYFCGSSGEYVFNTAAGEKRLFAPRGSVVYVPEGAEYTLKFTDCETDRAVTVLVEFGLTTPDGVGFAASHEAAVIKNDIDLTLKDMFDRTVEAYSQTVVSYSLIKSYVYGILSELSRFHRQKSIHSREFRMISKGIEYLEANINNDLSVEDIAEMCHVSPSCFRRLFKKYSGQSPVTYRTEAKMEYAKSILRSETAGVSETAKLLMFEDTAYFCRVFKKYTGYTPGEYAGFFKKAQK